MRTLFFFAGGSDDWEESESTWSSLEAFRFAIKTLVFDTEEALDDRTRF